MTLPKLLISVMVSSLVSWAGVIFGPWWLVLAGLGLAFGAMGLWIQYDRKTYGNE